MYIIKYLSRVAILFLLAITLSGCKQGPEVIQTNNKIEAAKSYDLKKFIQVKDEGKYDINILEDNINRNEFGTYKVVYEIVDEENNNFTYEFAFEVVDTTPPKIDSKEITVYVGEEFNIYDLFIEGYWYKIIDEYDGRITSTEQITVDKEIDTSNENDGIIKVTAIDSSGNKIEKEINYRVKKLTCLEYILRNQLNKGLNLSRFSDNNGKIFFNNHEPNERGVYVEYDFTKYEVRTHSSDGTNVIYTFDENFTITRGIRVNILSKPPYLEFIDIEDVVNEGYELIKLMKNLEDKLTDGKFSIFGLEYSEAESTFVE